MVERDDGIGQQEDSIRHIRTAGHMGLERWLKKTDRLIAQITH
jgi:hypothetical protein